VRWRPDKVTQFVSNQDLDQPTEKLMYFGGGILGTILVLALIVYFVRRA
jgi:hypothetical protein